MSNEELVIRLIREELRCKKLTFSLENLGFECIVYTINISPVILELIGFQKISDELSDFYNELIEKALEETNYWNIEKMLEKWPLLIYIELQKLALKEGF